MKRYLLFSFTTALIISVATITSSCSPSVAIANKQPTLTGVPVGGKKFEQATATATKSKWHNGNHIETLVNGDEFYPAMIKSIKAAKKTITFETYAFVEGVAAYNIITALCERARSGVKIHMVLDYIGSKEIGQHNIDSLRQSGVELFFYHPPSILSPLRYNVRDHRKIMVVDGKVGFTGGCGVGDSWLGDAENEKQWRETHFRITGPVVEDLQRGFIINWNKVGGGELSGIDYFPSLKRTGAMKAQAFDSAPRDKVYTIPYLYRQAFDSAEKSIIIENPYIIFDDPLLKSILAARKRGVHVEIITSSDHCDSWLVRRVSLFQYPKLLKAGVHIYEFQPSLIHSKVMVVDGLFTSIGSANFDQRSLYLNDESNVNILDKSFANEQLKIIEADKRRSIRITKAKHPLQPQQLFMKLLLNWTEPQI